MSANITSALEQLNDAMGRTYTIQECGMDFLMVMPSGGKYPVCDARTLVERLVRMRIAAEGRIR